MKLPDSIALFLDRGGDSLLMIAAPLSILLVPQRVFAYVGRGLPHILCVVSIVLSVAAIYAIRRAMKDSRMFGSAMEIMANEQKLMRDSRVASVVHAREMLHWMRSVNAGPDEIASYMKLLRNLEATLDE